MRSPALATLAVLVPGVLLAQSPAPPSKPAPPARASEPAARPPATPTTATRQERAPRETKTALLNGKKVSVEYGRPALGGRTVQSLLAQLPPDRTWRAGVDQVTTFTTEADVVIGGQKVPAGRYSMYLYAPESGDYALLLNKDLGVPLKTVFAAAPPELANEPWPHLGTYETVRSSEVARVPLRKAAVKEPMERFLIALEPAVNGRSAITLTWGDQSWTADLVAAR